MYKAISLADGTRLSGFDWDAGNREKCQKHGLTTAAIETLFQGQIDVRPDPTHSVSERRYLAVARNDQGRSVFLVFTARARGDAILIRPISARYMHEKELARYEKAAKAATDPEDG